MPPPARARTDAPVHHLTNEQARRVAIRAQVLDARRTTDLLTLVDRLTFLQIDPTAAIAPSADLVAWSRLGSSYRPEQLTRALEQDRTLFEHNALIRPMGDVGLYLAGASDWPTWERTRLWIEQNDAFRRDIIERLSSAGPLASRDIPDTCVVPWASTGWTNNRNVTQMLECLMMRGEVAISGRIGRERLWDVPERVYPADAAIPPVEEAERRKNERRLASLGIARAKAPKTPMEPADVGPVGEPAVVEGTKGEWRVDPAALDDDDFEGRTALLSPFDRLVHNRVRAGELFDFEYTLEMYKPATKRRWGYFALPVLHHDRLVGKVDALADRDAGMLRVNAIHEDVTFTKAIAKDVRAELDDLAVWLGLGDVVVGSRHSGSRLRTLSCRYDAVMESPDPAPLASATRSGIVGTLVVAVAFFDGVVIGAPVALLMAAVGSVLVFAAAATAVACLVIVCCAWLDRQWDDWLSGSGTRMETALEKMRTNRLMRRPLGWIGEGTDRRYALAAAVANPILVAAFTRSLTNEPVGERRILAGAVAYAVPYVAMWSVVGLVLGAAVRAA